jgi:hypothetical protein
VRVRARELVQQQEQVLQQLVQQLVSAQQQALL